MVRLWPEWNGCFEIFSISKRNGMITIDLFIFFGFLGISIPNDFLGISHSKKRITFPHHCSIVWKEKNIIYMFWFPRCCIFHPKYHEFPPCFFLILPRGRNPSAMVMSRRGVTGVTGVTGETMRSCWSQECPSSCVDDLFQLQSGGSWRKIQKKIDVWQLWCISTQYDLDLVGFGVHDSDLSLAYSAIRNDDWWWFMYTRMIHKWCANVSDVLIQNNKCPDGPTRFPQGKSPDGVEFESR